MRFAFLTSVDRLKTIFFPVREKAYVQKKSSSCKYLSSKCWKQTVSFPIKTGKSFGTNLEPIKTVHSPGSPVAGTRETGKV